MGCFFFFFDRWELFLCCDVAENLLQNLLQGKTMRVSSNKYIMYEKSYDVISPYETVGEVKLEPLSLFLFAVIVLLPPAPVPSRLSPRPSSTVQSVSGGVKPHHHPPF